MNASAELFDVIVRRLLDQTAPPAPAIREGRALRSSPRSVVRRLLLQGNWCGHDRIICKQIVGDGGAERFDRELAALRLLSQLDLAPPLTPRLLACDPDARLFLLEDAGNHTLAKLLFGHDRPAARSALFAYASALGHLHAGTANLQSTTITTSDARAAVSPLTRRSRDLPRAGEGFRQLCMAAGAAVDASFENDVRDVEDRLAAPGSFRVLTHGDPCPDNVGVSTDGAVFFDFETGCFDHALLDAAYLVMAFPTCWCVGTIPPEVLVEAQATYCEALSAGVPQAADATIFRRHLLHASARWLLTRDAVVPRAQRTEGRALAELLGGDWTWGPATARQRLMYRLQAFIQLADAVGELRGLHATAIRLHRALAARWPAEVHQLALFPVFRGASGDEQMTPT